MLELIIIRGLPGSGKTTMAKEQFPDHILCEADQFFTTPEGEFQYDRTKVKDAHKFCITKAANALRDEKSVVVANQFARLHEMRPYVELADMLDAKLKVYECYGEYESVHMTDPEYLAHIKTIWEPICEECADG